MDLFIFYKQEGKMEINNINAIDIQYDKQEISKAPNFTHLVLGGGGFMGAVYLGAFSFLSQETEIFKNIKTYIGTSVGALFATALVLEIPMNEIEKYWKYIFNEDTLLFDINIMNIFNLFNDYGLDSGLRCIENIKTHLKEITFLDLAKKTGKDLIICATNALTMESVYFSVDTTPNVLVFDAINASCAIPIINKPIKIGDTYYIDGGVIDHIPVSIIPKNVSTNNILLMSLVFNIVPVTTEFTFPILLSNIMNTLIKNPGLLDIYKNKYKYYIEFTNIPVRSLEYKIVEDKMYICTSIEKIDKCFEIGYKTMFLKYKSWTL